METNSDRLYWTAGIIVIGAIIVAIASKMFPNIAWDVVNKIQALIKGAGDGSAGSAVTQKMIDPSNLIIYGRALIGR